jgi:hypothetical protein
MTKTEQSGKPRQPAYPSKVVRECGRKATKWVLDHSDALKPRRVVMTNEKYDQDFANAMALKLRLNREARAKTIETTPPEMTSGWRWRARLRKNAGLHRSA